MRFSKTSPHNNLETNEEILREKYISAELRQKIIDNLSFNRKRWYKRCWNNGSIKIFK